MQQINSLQILKGYQMNIKEMVRNDNVAEFRYYRDGNLWYRVQWMAQNLSIQEFMFPVPIEDIGNATFNHTERALLMMRYIRKHIKTTEEQEN